MYQEIYYLAYSGVCVLLAVSVAGILRRSRSVFLRDGFRERPEVVRALGHLLDTGLYLISGGYLALSMPNYFPLRTPSQVALAVVGKLGGYLLLLGCVHTVDLLILAMVRHRSLRVVRVGELT